MALRYRIPLPGPFYYSGRVGPEHWLPRSSRTGPGPIGFMVKWFIIYPSVAFFGAGLGDSSFAVESPKVSAGRSVFPCSAPPAYALSRREDAARKRLAMEGRPFGLDRYV